MTPSQEQRDRTDCMSARIIVTERDAGKKDVFILVEKKKTCVDLFYHQDMFFLQQVTFILLHLKCLLVFD